MHPAEDPALVFNPSRLISNMVEFCFSENDAPHLALNHQFMSVSFRAHPIVRLLAFASTELHIALSSRFIVPAFEVSQSAVTCVKLRGCEDFPGRRKNHELDPDFEYELIDSIAKKATNGPVVNKIAFLHDWKERVRKGITREWAESFVKRHAEELSKPELFCKGIQDRKCLGLFSKWQENCLRDHVHNSYAELVFNLDKIGINEWEDRTERRIIVSSTIRGLIDLRRHPSGLENNIGGGLHFNFRGTHDPFRCLFTC
jgi:hypothetical protein